MAGRNKGSAMGFATRRLGPLLGLAIASGLYWQAIVSTATAATPIVTIFDNDAPPPSGGFDPRQGLWGYAPHHMMVTRGETVVFNNPSSNTLPHTVTNIERTSGAFENALTAGTRFDSSPTREALIMPGASWSLDTSGLEPGHYLYYCRIHPWMAGQVTVVVP